MEWQIPLSDIDLGEEEIASVTSVLRSKWLSMGPITEQFEREFAKYLGVKHAFAAANGTAALHIACKVLDIDSSDELIVPSLTFVATANVILYVDATPIFADITSLDDFNISPEDISKKITDRTKGIIVVHYGGYPCDMDAVMTIARKNGLSVIEDAAHAPGAEYKGKKLGTIGDIGCFSFFANKNLVTGEGGMIVTNDDVLAQRIKVIRSHGMTTLTWDRRRGRAHSYDVVDIGYNYRISEVESALGLVQLKKLRQNNKRRGEVTEIYRDQLKSAPGISIPFQDCEEKPSYHILPVLLKENISRENIIEGLKAKGVQTSIHYPPVHLLSSYRQMFSYKEGMLPNTEFVGQHEVTLPLYPMLTDEDVHYIVDCVKEASK